MPFHLEADHGLSSINNRYRAFLVKRIRIWINAAKGEEYEDPLLELE